MRLLILLTALWSLLLFSCKEPSTYIDYTWNDSTVDADSDGIPDIAEEEGTSFYGMPLHLWGARPGVRDLFVHVALMEPASSSNPDGGLLLQEEALNRVVARFAENGIALHFDAGRTGLYKEYGEVGTRGSDRYNLSNKNHTFPYNPSIFLSESVLSGSSAGYVFVDEIKATQMPANKDSIFYFMVMGSSQNSDGSGGSSGVAWNRPGQGGNEFLVTLANWGLGFGTNSSLGLTRDHFENYVVNKQASTIMHEFGHNLGLGHGGDESRNYKPNYYSIMNYSYQLQGLPRVGSNEWDRYYYERYSQSYDGSSFDAAWAFLMDRSFTIQQYNDYGYLTLLPIDFIDSPYSSTFRMDYSYGEGGSLNEASLNESDGLRQSGSGSIDWNGDGSINNPVMENINPSYDSLIETLNDHNDWGNLIFYYDATAPSGRFHSYTEKNIVVEEHRDITIIPFERSR